MVSSTERTQMKSSSLARPAGAPGRHSFNAFYRGNLYCKGSILPSGVRHHLLSPEPWSVPWVCHPPGNRRHLAESLRLPPALLPGDQDKYAFLLKINHFTKTITYSR